MSTPPSPHLTAISLSLLAPACTAEHTETSAPTEAAAPVPESTAEDEPGTSEAESLVGDQELNLSSDMFENLAVAWYDAAGGDLLLMCESNTAWLHTDPDQVSGCSLDKRIEEVFVVDAFGTLPWAVQPSAKGPSHDPKLVRPDPQRPPASMPLLVLPRSPDSLPTLVASPMLDPSAGTRSLADDVEHEIAALDDLDAGALRATALAELPGAFGGRADTIGLFQLESNMDFEGSRDVVVAISGRELLAAFGDEPTEGGGYQLVGTMDLDGDGMLEALWWTRSVAGIGLDLTHFAEGEYRQTTLFQCQCGAAFLSSYRGTQETTAR